MPSPITTAPLIRVQSSIIWGKIKATVSLAKKYELNKSRRDFLHKKINQCQKVITAHGLLINIVGQICVKIAHFGLKAPIFVKSKLEIYLLR